MTLRRGCWLLMRETKDHKNSFALRLEPGDIYTLVSLSKLFPDNFYRNTPAWIE
jgi:hypothetical protein